MPLHARQFVRKMRGGAQAHLLEAEDGRWYVVKFRNNPQGVRILVNEMIASHLLRYLGIATPETAVVSITREFLESNPEVYLQLGSTRRAVEPGWHFGSCYPGDPARLAVYDLLPDTLVAQVANRSHFLGVLVADKWMGNVDARQSVFFRAQVGEGTAGIVAPSRKVAFWAQMIDHGYAFGGPEWSFQDGPLHGLAPRPVVYQEVRGWKNFEPWLERVAALPAVLLDEARRRIPESWLDGDGSELDRLLEKLFQRKRRVADRIAECRQARPSWFPNWT